MEGRTTVPAADKCDHTFLKVKTFNYQWTTHNFSCRPESVGIRFISPIFHIIGNSKYEGYLHLYPKGNKSEGFMALFLFLKCAAETEVNAKYKFSILNAEGNAAYSLGPYTAKFKGKSGWGWDKLIKLDYLLNKENQLLPEDNLTIFCEIEIIEDNVNDIVAASNGKLKEPKLNLAQDLSKLLDSGKFCDLLLSVEGNEFKAHKNILAARSSVFAAMFETEINEQKPRKIIGDVKPEVFKEMLDFIYTDTAPNLKRLANDLLPLADKYALPELKGMCENVLICSLSIDSAADKLLLAEIHRANDLKLQTMSFIKNNINEIIKTKQWHEMIAVHPHLAIEAFQSLD